MSYLNKIKICLIVIAVGFSSIVYSQNVYAIKDCESDGSNTAICKTTTDSITNIIKQVINILLIIGGAIAVLMVVIGGIRYITSDGDSGRISQAKSTILYALIGLIVAILAYAIVNFVLERILNNAT